MTEEQIDRLMGMKTEVRVMISELEEFFGMGSSMAFSALSFYENLAEAAVLERHKASGTHTATKQKGE